MSSRQDPLCPRCGGLLVEEWDQVCSWFECIECGTDYDVDDVNVYDEEEAA